MKLPSKLFALAVISILSTGAVMADEIGQDLLYGTQATEVDFSRMPATAAGRVDHNTSMSTRHSGVGSNYGVNAIPDYLEGQNANQ